MKPIDSKLLALDNQLFIDEILDQIASGNRVTIKAKGWSMIPLVWDEVDSITLAPLSNDSFQIGHIVLARLGDNRYVVHRISHIKGDRFTLRGDGNPYQYEYCHRDEICAELVLVRRYGRHPITPKSILWKTTRHLWPKHGWTKRVAVFFASRIIERIRSRHLQKANEASTHL